MWKKQDCTRQRKIVKATKRYASDLTDKEWETLRPLLPGYASQGRPRHTQLREVINALRYVVRSGCSWRMLPKEFGSWQTIYWWFRRLMRRFLFSTILNICIMLDRFRYQKKELPSLGILDSQSVKAPQAKARGIDGNKKIVGRKRHVAVDSDGRLLLVNAVSKRALNMTLFGMTAKQWRAQNPDAEGNIRDYTDIYQLIILVNLEIMNAELIKQGISQGERLEYLNSMAIEQMYSLINNL